MSQINQPGFVFNTAPQQQPQQPAYPSYPTNQEPGGYPSQKPPGYPPQQQPPPAYQHQPFPAPIQSQPGQQGYAFTQSTWYANPNFQDYLRNATSFHVKQKVEVLEILTGFETENKYTVKDQNGNKIFYVIEESNCCGRLCLNSGRPFTLRVKDARGLDILVLERGIDCSLCCGLFCPDSLRVTDAAGNLLGSIGEECSLLYPKFKLNDATGLTRMKADGPVCPMACGGSVTFGLRTPDGARIGQISKEWAGIVQELFTDADNFSMSFPPNLEPNMKAVCLGLLFLIVSIISFVVKPPIKPRQDHSPSALIISSTKHIGFSILRGYKQ